MARQVLALFDECQSKENAKRTLRAMQENGRQASGMGQTPLPHDQRMRNLEMTSAF
jgi:hypothetical protein